MKRGIIVGATLCLAVAFSIPLRLAAAPEFLAYEGRNAIHEGQGGEKKTVDGIDFWSNGDPPHRFKVLGSITDRRHETGLYGAIRMSSLTSDIAKAAKAAGGDAVILQSEDEDVTGHAAYVTGGTGFAVGRTREIKEHDVRYIVVKYLPDDDPAPTNSAATSK
ncbi:MAG: hypothetical protein ACHP84_04240 [Caulobacterales bacterium]